MTEVVRVLFQNTKQNLWDSFSWTISENSYLSGTHWAKEFCSFPYQILNCQEEQFEQSFLKTPRVFDFFSHCARNICIVISLLRFTCLEKKLLDDNIKFPKNFVFSYFCLLFEQNLVVLGCSICILRLQETNFSERDFEEIQKKGIIFWNLIEKCVSWPSGIFNLRGQWNSFSKETWNFQKRGMFTVVDQKVLDWCYHIFILRAKEDIFVGKKLVEMYSEVIGF